LVRKVNLTHLDSQQRKKWWARIQSEAPGLAEALQDPQVVFLRKKLNGQVIITIDDNGNILDGKH